LWLLVLALKDVWMRGKDPMSVSDTRVSRGRQVQECRGVQRVK
jgi:hypothetical protein